MQFSFLTVGREESSVEHAVKEGVERRKVGSEGIPHSVRRSVFIRLFLYLGKELTMLCTWSIFPFFPLSFQLVVVKTKESGPSGGSDEFCPKLSSESVHSYRAPTPMLPPHFLNRLGLSELLSRCGQRPDLSGSHLHGGVRGSISVCLVHPTINSMLTSSPLHQGHSSRVTICMTSLSCRPCFWFFFFLTFVACVTALCFTPWF